MILIIIKMMLVLHKSIALIHSTFLNLIILLFIAYQLKYLQFPVFFIIKFKLI